MVYAEPMARAVVEPAVRELMQQASDGGKPSTTVELGGDGFTMCAHVRVQLTAPGQAEVALACWVVNMDTARFFGSTPPTEDEKRLSPEGVASWDEALTRRVIGHLAARMKALDAPQEAQDDHLTLTVPLVPG
ncbi:MULTISPECIES: hypothetical protein [unclassified Streptomyces]|uniref:hypothetical protein n=1 Tax=unclassified Streptomyces TaxID=2593676 RepID=UPI0036E91104